MQNGNKVSNVWNLVQCVMMDICTIYTEKQMSSVKAAMLRICVFWDVTQLQLFPTFHRNMAFILKDPCTLVRQGTALLANVSGHLHSNTASHPTRLEYSQSAHSCNATCAL